MREPDWGGMPCIACGVECKFFSPPKESIYPMVQGTQFEATGNYGSTAYDPVGTIDEKSYLQIVVCNDCIRKYADRVHFIRWEREILGDVKSDKKIHLRETFKAPPYPEEE